MCYIRLISLIYSTIFHMCPHACTESTTRSCVFPIFSDPLHFGMAPLVFVLVNEM